MLMGEGHTITVGRYAFEELQRVAFDCGVPLSVCMAPEHKVALWKHRHKAARERPMGHKPMRHRRRDRS